MSTVATLMCEHCGAPVAGPHAKTTRRGIMKWTACPRCAKASRSRGRLFGCAVQDLPEPLGSPAGWWTYRLACAELGYTLWTAKGRPERDRLHARWNGWLSSVLTMQRDRGTMLYRDALEGGAYVEEAAQKWPGPHLTARWAAWLIPRVTHDSKRHLLTATPTRDMLEEALGIPKRGALSRMGAG